MKNIELEQKPGVSATFIFIYDDNFISVASEKIPSSLTLEQTPQVFS